MSASGQQMFQITDLVDGISVPSPERGLALPISLIEPASFELRKLIGTDLAGDRKLESSLSKSVVENSTVAIAIPENWPAANQLMLLQPAYRGLSVPEQFSARIEQADGGYLLIIDPLNYLDDIAHELLLTQVSSISLALEKLDKTILLASNQYPSQQFFATRWFDRPVYKRTFEVGDAMLNLTIKGNKGIPYNHLIAALCFLFLAIASFVAVMLWLRDRQRAATEKKLSHDALRTERDRTARTLHLISDAVITVNPHCQIQHVNTTGAQFLDGAPQDFIEKPLDNFLSLRYREQPSHRFNALQLLNGMRSGELKTLDLVSTSDTDTAVFHSTVSLNSGNSKNPATAVFVFRDISAEKRLTAALEYQANHDALTGCANRYCFERCLRDSIEKRTSKATEGALLCFDLDRFKIINDTAGHAAGDQMLLHLTKELKQSIGSDDMLARLGGDEFALLMGDVSPAEAEHKAKVIHEIFQTMMYLHQGRGYPIRASLGLAHFSEVGNSPSEVMAAADMACYAAKDLGRNHLYIYRAGDATIARRTSELEWLSLLRQALAEDRFRLHAQPLVSTSNPDVVCRYEFLLRLVDEEGNSLQAGQIINAAERYGMMREIDRWVIDHALAIIAEQTRQFKQTTLVYAINLSGQSAADPTLIDYISDKMMRYLVNPRYLCFEITETAAISHFSNAVALSQSIRNMGAQIALDDFGAGLSSFAYLKNLPIDVLKIDGQFIREITDNPSRQGYGKSYQGCSQINADNDGSRVCGESGHSGRTD